MEGKETMGEELGRAHVAVINGNIDLLRDILCSKESFDEASDWLGTPTMVCASLNHWNMLAMLIDSGVDVDKKCPKGRTALMMAAAFDCSQSLALLLRAGAQVDMADALGRTALMFAAGNGYVGCVELLVTAGANVELLCSEGLSAKGKALKNGHDSVAGFMDGFVLSKKEKAVLMKSLGTGVAKDFTGKEGWL